ncbi:hypothetical protein PanWU01x14_254930 [Parasponia andersonii]|uniref:Uncharacterized protein n=1 Tax=Parasponia andersonii TaxID=3476 RepID=A0A2P5BB13_PARAD|nr:hypothetical protein PanWU01x14_254930 [Parasponia andersonii]
MEDQQKVFSLLKGLGNDYDSFIISMLKPPVPLYNDTIQLLQSYENMKSLHNPIISIDEHAAFLAQNKNNSGKSFTNNRQGQILSTQKAGDSHKWDKNLKIHLNK